MRKLFGLFSLLGLLALATASASAQELLINGGLDDPGTHEGDVAVGWGLTEGPLNSAMPPVLANSATFASFADRVDDPGDATEVGLWFRAFAGGGAAPAPATVFADLTQSVPGTAGQKYLLSAWARFETHYAGGVDNLNDGPPEPDGSSTDGAPSPTDTFLAIDFLGAGNSLLGSAARELRAGGQVNNAGWLQHFVSGTAPAGTLLVQVRGSMVNGVVNPGVNPQSAFLDDFSLTVIPEPSSVALLGLGLVGLSRIRRRK